MIMIGLAAFVAFIFYRTTDAIPSLTTSNVVEVQKFITNALSRQLVSTSGIWIIVAIFCPPHRFWRQRSKKDGSN